MAPRKTRTAAAAQQSPKPERSSKRLSKKAEPDVIELSSGSESEYDSSGEAEQAPAAANKPSAKRGLAAEEQGATPASKRQRKLPVRATRGRGGDEGAEEDEESAEDVKEEFVTPAASKGKHIVFGDDGDDDEGHNEKFYTPLEAPASKRNPAGSSHPPPVPEEEDEDEDEDEDSDDEAPEAVTSTKVAVNDSRKQAERMAKALEQQEAARRKKRQERDALFRQQAEARKTALQASGSGGGGGGRRRADKTGIPALLPAEFLESDEESEDEEAAAALLAKPRKITFGEAERKLSKEGRPVRDQQVGSTVYRVAAVKGDQKLAPKMQKYSRSTKEEMLGRKRGVQKKGGFLAKRK